jgi:hypothetical protein
MSQQVPFPGHFNLFTGKLLFREITLSLYFAANDRKPNKRLKFSTEVQWKKWQERDLNPQPSEKCQLPYPLSYEA